MESKSPIFVVSAGVSIDATRQVMKQVSYSPFRFSPSFFFCFSQPLILKRVSSVPSILARSVKQVHSNKPLVKFSAYF